VPLQLEELLVLLRFLANWEEAETFVQEKIAQAQQAEPIGSLEAVEAAEKEVRPMPHGGA